MNLLIVGGGVFLGKAVADEAIKRRHRVTVFNRGNTTKVQPEGAEWIRGDRDGSLDVLQGRRWDAVVDTSAYFPGQVMHLRDAIGSSIGHYALISSVSAYRDLSRGGITEESELAAEPDISCNAITQDTYGPLKAACEGAVRSYGGTCPILLVRPGILVGPGDPTGRFAYWVARLARGGDILAPGDPQAPIQLLDARDLAVWLVDRAERRTAGAFNTVGPSMTWDQMLGSVASVVASDSRLVWIADGFLADNGVSEWTSLPFFVPKSPTEFSGMFKIDGSSATQLGLGLRALEATARDTAAWLNEGKEAAGLPQGLAAGREAELIAAWFASGNS